MASLNCNEVKQKSLEIAKSALTTPTITAEATNAVAKLNLKEPKKRGRKPKSQQASQAQAQAQAQTEENEPIRYYTRSQKNKNLFR